MRTFWIWLLLLLSGPVFGQSRGGVLLRPEQLDNDANRVWRLGGVTLGPNGYLRPGLNLTSPYIVLEGAAGVDYIRTSSADPYGFRVTPGHGIVGSSLTAGGAYYGPTGFSVANGNASVVYDDANGHWLASASDGLHSTNLVSPLLTVSGVGGQGTVSYNNGWVFSPALSVGGGGTWGSITGTLSDQTDLQSALNGKQTADADLTAIAALVPSASGKVLKWNGSAWGVGDDNDTTYDLSNLNATYLTSGTVADARLSSNVPLLNAANTFTNAQTVSLPSSTGLLFGGVTPDGNVLQMEVVAGSGADRELFISNSVGVGGVRIGKSGADSAYLRFVKSGADGGTYYMQTDQPNYAFSKAGGSDLTRVRFLSVSANLTGKVGVGFATVPTYSLHVAPTTGATAGQTLFVQDATASTGSTRAVIRAGAGQAHWLLEAQNNSGASVGGIDMSGNFIAPAFKNPAGSANSMLTLGNSGSVVSRNVADANAALLVNQAHASSTGNILTLQKAGTTVSSFDTNGAFSGPLANALTAGTGLTSTGTYNGGTARTFAVDFGTGATQAAAGNHLHTGVYQGASAALAQLAGLAPTTTGQVIKWNQTAGAWELGTDNTGGGGLTEGGNLTGSVATADLYSFIPNAYHATANTYAALVGGSTNASNNQTGVKGLSYGGYGVYGQSTGSTGHGVYGKSTGSGYGVYGESASGYGLGAVTTGGSAGLNAASFSNGGPAILAYNTGSIEALRVNQAHTSADIATFQKSATTVARVTNAGKGVFAGLNVGALAEYTDNAAALTGGLVIGDLYRTGDVLKVVY